MASWPDLFRAQARVPRCAVRHAWPRHPLAGLRSNSATGREARGADTSDGDASRDLLAIRARG